MSKNNFNTVTIKIARFRASINLINLCTLLLFLILLSLHSGCGRVYFPFKLESVSRSERDAAQTKPKIELLALTEVSASEANKSRYNSLVRIKGGDGSSSKLVNSSNAIKERFPPNVDPGEYKIGSNDILGFTLIDPVSLQTREFDLPVISDGSMNILNYGKIQAVGLTVGQVKNKIAQKMIDSGEIGVKNSSVGSYPKQKSPGDYTIGNYDRLIFTIIGNNTQNLTARSFDLLVSGAGSINLLTYGNIAASGLTVPQLKDKISERLVREGIILNFELSIKEFNSKNFYVNYNKLPYVSVPIYLEDLLSGLTAEYFRSFSEKTSKALKLNLTELSRIDGDAIIKIIREGQEYNISALDLFRSHREKFRVFPDDQIIISPFNSIRFELTVKRFNSKSFFVNYKKLPYISIPIYLKDILSSSDLQLKEAFSLGKQRLENYNLADLAEVDRDAEIKIIRADKEYRVSALNLFRQKSNKIRILPEDQIIISPLKYYEENVLIIGETGAQVKVPINSVARLSLSDVVFSGQTINSLSSDISQIYLLRERNPQEFIAYHLDITNPTRATLASKIEMRPRDIVYVAAQPLTLYNRVLGQILTSVNLTNSSVSVVSSAAN